MVKFRSWTFIATLSAAVFSAIFSGIFLVIASVAPQWGKHIGSHGILTEAGASIVTQLLAKLIEVTFVTTCLGCLGQRLSRCALDGTINHTRLSELCMRNWILQPGTLFTHPEPVRSSGFTILGGLSILATTLTLLYTTSASALGKLHLD